jgi:MOSC domain-containing protein YiiM
VGGERQVSSLMAASSWDLRGVVVAVSRSEGHSFAKVNRDSVRLIAGLGVDGDAHAGATVKHRSRVARDPAQPNLRQVHLIHDELLHELEANGFLVQPGELGENLTTRGLALLDLPLGARLRIGEMAVVEITGLRNPCVQIDRFQTGLLAEVASRNAAGEVVRRAGIMSVVLTGGVVRPGDPIVVELPAKPHRTLPVV